MLFANPDDRVKADFFIELYPVLTDRAVVMADWYKRDKIIDRMLFKYENRKSGLRAITDFRKIKQHITTARAADQTDRLLVRLKEFLDDDELDIEHLAITRAKIHRTAVTLTKTLSKVHEQLKDLDPKNFYGEEEMWMELERLLQTIQRKLRDADRGSR